MTPQRMQHERQLGLPCDVGASVARDDHAHTHTQTTERGSVYSMSALSKSEGAPPRERTHKHKRDLPRICHHIEFERPGTFSQLCAASFTSPP